MEASGIIGSFKELVAGPDNRFIRDWKTSGRPVVGYFCQYTPVELILAAGALPVRLRAAWSRDSSSGDALMSGRICTFVRHVMSRVLDGEYGFLDGVVVLNTCDHVRRAADVFKRKTSIPFQSFISVPRSVRPTLLPFYLEELKNLYGALCGHFGSKADPEALEEAIRAMNRVRGVRSTLDSFRTPDPPILSGADALAVHIASHVMPPEEFMAMASPLAESLRSAAGRNGIRARLVFIGAELDEPAYLEVVEGEGAAIVADRICFGSRSAGLRVAEGSADSLDSIGRAYFFADSCARMIGGFPDRFRELEAVVRDSRADGVVFQRLIFCDPWGADLHNIIHRQSREKRFPILSLSREYGIAAAGQLRTRVQAFLERIEISKAGNAGGAS